MANIDLVTYTMGELSEDLGALRKYQDPFGYLDECTPKWGRDLKSNPSAKNTDLAIIFAVDNDTLVGRLGMWAAVAAIDGTPTSTFLLALFLVHENYRNSGVGGMMLLRAISHSRCLVAAGPIPPEVQRLYLAAGFRELGPLKRYVYFYSTNVLFRKFLVVPWLATVLSVLTTPILKLYYWMRRKGPKSSLVFQPVTTYSDRIDALPRQGNHFPRNSATLNWLLATRQGLHGFEVIRDGQFSGFCLLRVTEAQAQSSPRRLPAMRVGSLLDYYIEGATPSDKRALIDHCLSFFKPRRADVFECQSKDESLVDVCSRLGMIQVGGFRVLFRPPSGMLDAVLEPWHLAQGEGDVILG